MTLQKKQYRKTTKKFTLRFLRRSHQALTSVQCVASLFMLFVGVNSEDSEVFGLKVTCSLCVRKNRINIVRESVKSGQEQEAQKMVSLSNSRLPAVDIGTNVVVRVPDLDRGRLAPPPPPRNVLTVVVGVNSSGLYLLGTKESLLERLHASSEFTAADNNFVEAHDVPSSTLSLRSASMITSRNTQGFVSCHCKR